MTGFPLDDEAKDFIKTAEILAEPYLERIAALEAQVRSLRGVAQAVRERDEHWWAARALMAICDNATTWQAGSGDEFDPLLVGVTEASHVVGRMVAAALAAASDALHPDPPCNVCGEPVYLDPHERFPLHRSSGRPSCPPVRSAGLSPAVLPEDGCADCTEAGTKNCTAGCRDTPR